MDIHISSSYFVVFTLRKCFEMGIDLQKTCIYLTKKLKFCKIIV